LERILKVIKVRVYSGLHYYIETRNLKEEVNKLENNSSELT